MSNDLSENAATRRSPLTRALMSVLLLFFFASFSALGIWQMERLSRKLDLIARVDARVHAEPIAPPAKADWNRISETVHEYLHVRAAGTYDYSKDVLVQASTERGPGYWVMTPLRLTDGTTILVNRGFVPDEKRTTEDRRQGEVVGAVMVAGLLRISEPGGSLLRNNDPAAGRWYSRDVAAILARDGIPDGAPYFVDADATPNPGGLPVGGMTIIRFPNNHLVYAITWFGLALMVAGAAIYLWRSESRARREPRA